MQKSILFLTLFVLGIHCLWAQTQLVTGSVVDAETQEPIPGVNIIIEGASDGTISNVDGSFSLSVSPNAKLALSFIGYETKIIDVGERTILNVALEISTESLDEVVIVGYGVQKKESVVGAVAQVEGKSLLNSGVSNVTQSLAGKIPGLVTSQSSGLPGSDNATISIRGRSSWVSSAPLVMVDGIERSFADIDPNEVESISVLKDASATAIYGTRGANGVILVTTKRGSEGKPKVNVTFMQGIKEATSTPEYVDAYTTFQHANIAMKNDGNFAGLISAEELMNYQNGDQSYLYPDVDWIDEMIQTGYSTALNVNLRGGTKRVKYFNSIGYNYEGDILRSEKVGKLDPRFYSNRFNLRSNLDIDVTKTSRVVINVGANHRVQNGNFGYFTDFFKNLYELSVNYSPLYYGEDALAQYPDPSEPGFNGIRYAQGVGEGKNPYTILHNGLARFDTDVHVLENKRITTTDLNTDLGWNQDLTFLIEGLEVSALASLNTTVAYERLEKQQGASYILNENGTWRRAPSLEIDLEPLAFDSYSIQENTRKFYWQVQVNYSRQFRNHLVTALALFNRSKRDVSSGGNSVEPPYKREAWSGRVTYAYALKYLFEVNLGYSGSEQFSPQKRFGFFPAVAIGWNLAEERFMKKAFPFIDQFKFRYSIGKTGSDISPDRWLYQNEGYTSYWRANTMALFGPTFGQEGTYLFQEGQIANPVAQWEESLKKNFGIETAFFDEKLTFSIDFFREDREKILMTLNTIPDYVSLDLKSLNLGKTKNHGYEIVLGYNGNTSFGLNYNISSNFSFNENRVVFRSDPENLPAYQKLAGFPIGTQRHYLQDGLYQSVDDVVNYLHKSPNVGQGDVRFVDYNADGVINEKDEVALPGTQYPLYSYAFNAGISYKGFSINALVQGVDDKKSYFNTISSDPFYRSNYRIYGYQVDDYWTPDNPDAFYPATHMDVTLKSSNNDLSYAQRYLNTGYVRLKELQLAYSFKPEWENFPTDFVMVFINGNNLITWSEFAEVGDPEKSSFTPGNRNTSYPLLRRYNVGLKLNF